MIEILLFSLGFCLGLLIPLLFLLYCFWRSL
jgi:hypothetical protein